MTELDKVIYSGNNDKFNTQIQDKKLMVNPTERSGYHELFQLINLSISKEGDPSVLFLLM